MGHRYYARVTFPRAALGIVDIRAAVDAFITAENGSWGYQLEHEEDEGDDTITLSHTEANYGEVWCGNEVITSLLDLHKVPYDWYHDESEGGGDSFTVCVRWNAHGEMITKETSEASDAEVVLAKRVLDALKADGVADRALQTLLTLNEVLVKEPTPLADLNWSL
jgi:hypothetical protein